jgi:3-deoxy-D-manno-octulosonic-acid transferase
MRRDRGERVREKAENGTEDGNIYGVKQPSPFPNALDAAYAAILLAGSPVLAYRLLRTGKWRSDWRGRLGHAGPLPLDPRSTVLLHGVSVGEVAAAEPLVRILDGRGFRVAVSATTNTGFDRARALYGRMHPVLRHPLDFSRSVGRFLDAVAPDVVALMELEVWPNFTRACADREIPVVVVNGRLGAGSFRGYRRARALVAPSFRRLFGVAAQTEEYASRFRFLGAPSGRVSVADSLKWEVSLPDGIEEAARRLSADMGVDHTRPIVVAVSTGPGEEEMLLRGRPAGVQLMVVPRKPERFEEVASLGPWTRRSAHASSPGSSDLYLVDTMGEAEAATALADVVLIGRSWNGLGASNPVPAAILGKPTVVGPDHHNFAEMIDALVSGGAVRVAAEPWSGARTILSDAEARGTMSAAGPRVVRDHRGASEHNVALIEEAARAREEQPLGR